MHIADSLCCTAETNTLYSNNKIRNNPPQKKPVKKKAHVL